MSHLHHAFGPGDTVAIAVVPGKAFVLDEITDFSVSSHVDKVPIRRLGHRLPVGWATGSASIAGTIVCAQIGQGAFYKLRRWAGAARLLAGQALGRAGELDHYTAGILPQQLPPFHLVFVHASDRGSVAMSRLYNVVLSDQGEVKGARNAYTEETLQYQAAHYEQVRLHRAITVAEMQRLITTKVGDELVPFKTPGFFANYERPFGLVDDLTNIASDLVDPGDLAEYALKETTEVLWRAAKGEPTSIGIADVGEIAFVNGTAIRQTEGTTPISNSSVKAQASELVLWQGASSPEAGALAFDLHLTSDGKLFASPVSGDPEYELGAVGPSGRVDVSPRFLQKLGEWHDKRLFGVPDHLLFVVAPDLSSVRRKGGFDEGAQPLGPGDTAWAARWRGFPVTVSETGENTYEILLPDGSVTPLPNGVPTPYMGDVQITLDIATKTYTMTLAPRDLI